MQSRTEKLRKQMVQQILSQKHVFSELHFTQPWVRKNRHQFRVMCKCLERSTHKQITCISWFQYLLYRPKSFSFPLDFYHFVCQAKHEERIKEVHDCMLVLPLGPQKYKNVFHVNSYYIIRCVHMISGLLFPTIGSHWWCLKIRWTFPIEEEM